MSFKLGGRSILEAFRSGTWRAYQGDCTIPPSQLRIGPNSVDVTLHRTLRYPLMHPGEVLHLDGDPNQIKWATLDIGGDNGSAAGFTLMPGMFVLGAVNERFDCSALLHLNVGVCQTGIGGVTTVTDNVAFAPMYEGRSTCGRVGLASHITAGFGDYGFAGAFTLEIYNHFPYPIRLRPGMRIGQVAFEAVHRPMVYNGAYKGKNHHNGPVIPKIGPGRF